MSLQSKAFWHVLLTYLKPCARPPDGQGLRCISTRLEGNNVVCAAELSKGMIAGELLQPAQRMSHCINNEQRRSPVHHTNVQLRATAYERFIIFTQDTAGYLFLLRLSICHAPFHKSCLHTAWQLHCNSQATHLNTRHHQSSSGQLPAVLIPGLQMPSHPTNCLCLI